MEYSIWHCSGRKRRHDSRRGTPGVRGEELGGFLVKRGGFDQAELDAQQNAQHTHHEKLIAI